MHRLDNLSAMFTTYEEPYKEGFRIQVNERVSMTLMLLTRIRMILGTNINGDILPENLFVFFSFSR